jgi:hypothetical protein
MYDPATEFDKLVSTDRVPEIFKVMGDMLEYKQQNNEVDILNMIFLQKQRTQKSNTQNEEFKTNTLKKYNINIDYFVKTNKSIANHYGYSDISDFLISNYYATENETENLTELRKYLKDSYIRLIKSVPDSHIHRKSVEDERGLQTEDNVPVRLQGCLLEHIPLFLKKYNNLSEVYLNDNPFTSIDTNAFPKHVGKLDLSDCKRLVDIRPNTLPYTDELNLSHCTSLIKIHYPALNNEEGGVYPAIINVENTQITSMDKIVFEFDGDIARHIQIRLPLGFKSFESEHKKGIYLITYVFSDPQTELKSFYGMKTGAVTMPEGCISFKHPFSSNSNSIIPLTERNAQQYFPNIKNAFNKYNAYIRICWQYPLAYSESLAKLYKALEPESFLTFQTMMDKKDDYNIEPLILAKLIDRVLS